jgi:hypothetical protein
MNPLAVDGDPGARRIDARPELADDLAIDGDTSLEDQFLAGASRADPGMRQDLLKPLGTA